jgi:transcriptional regulator with XRE-family HTH domain
MSSESLKGGLINPYLQARRLLTLSQQQVAEQAGVSVSCVRYNEQGLFLNPIPKLTAFYERLFLRDALVRNYYRFQRRMRQENKKLWLLPEPNLFTEPLRATFRFNGIGVTRFCKNFCCQSVLLYQPKRLLGTDLYKILNQAGFTPVQLQELHDRLQEHYDRPVTDRPKSDHSDGAKVFRDGGDTDGRANSPATEPVGYNHFELFRQTCSQTNIEAAGN